MYMYDINPDRTIIVYEINACQFILVLCFTMDVLAALQKEYYSNNDLNVCLIHI